MTLAPPRLTVSPALQLHGLARRHACHSNAGIPAQWGDFAPHMDHIPGRAGATAYGVIRATDTEGSYEYICAVQVAAPLDTAGEFLSLQLPARPCLVFEHRGPIDAIGATWQAVWEHGIAEAGHKPLDGTAYERYDERFHPQSQDSIVELWIPVQP
jgi:AraC family transcriptional regulator